jgi:hypothetical protein
MSKTTTLTLLLLAVLALSTISIFNAQAANTQDLAKEKTSHFLSDVLQIDLSKYAVTDEGYGTSYPSQYGGAAMQESYSLTLNNPSSQVSISAVFLNGYIIYLQVHPVTGTVIFSQQPQSSSTAQAQQLLEAYTTWAETYGLDTSNLPNALNLLSKAHDAPLSPQTPNFYGITGFEPVNTTSSNMRMVASGSEIGFGYSFDGVDVRNRGLGMGFASGTFLFADTWGLYTVAAQSAISQEQATTLALEAAQNYPISLMSQNGTEVPVNPDWSNPRVEISLNMIPGQTFNNPVNNALNFVNSSSDREALGLYPYWNAFVYFTEQVGFIDGVQVGIWGDTSEIAQVNTFSQLSHPVTSIPTLPPEPNNALTVALIIGAALLLVAVVTLAFRLRR